MFFPFILIYNKEKKWKKMITIRVYMHWRYIFALCLLICCVYIFKRIIFVFQLQLITIMFWNIFFEGAIWICTYVLKCIFRGSNLKNIYILKCIIWGSNFEKQYFLREQLMFWSVWTIYGCWLVWLLLYIFIAAE